MYADQQPRVPMGISVMWAYNNNVPVFAQLAEHNLQVERDFGDFQFYYTYPKVANPDGFDDEYYNHPHLQEARDPDSGHGQHQKGYGLSMGMPHSN